jgi:hypothetical protein
MLFRRSAVNLLDFTNRAIVTVHHPTAAATTTSVFWFLRTLHLWKQTLHSLCPQATYVVCLYGSVYISSSRRMADVSILFSSVFFVTPSFHFLFLPISSPVKKGECWINSSGMLGTPRPLVTSHDVTDTFPWITQWRYLLTEGFSSSHLRAEIFLFCTSSRPVLWPTQWVLGAISGGKAAEAWSWPLTSHYFQEKEFMYLCIHSPIRLHSVVSNQLCTGKALHFTLFLLNFYEMW